MRHRSSRAGKLIVCTILLLLYLNKVRKDIATVNFKTGRFYTVDSAVIVSSVSKAVLNCFFQFSYDFVFALRTLLMITAECMLSKRLVLRFIAALFLLLKLFSSRINSCSNKVNFLKVLGFCVRVISYNAVAT